MSVRKNIAVARKWNEVVVNEKRVDDLGQVLHEQYEWRGGSSPWSVAQTVGLDAVRAMWADAMRQHPQWKVVVEDIIGQRDRVAVRMTHYDGDKPARNVIAFYRFEAGKIIEDWAAISDLK